MRRDTDEVKALVAKVRVLKDTDPEKERLEKALMLMQGFYFLHVMEEQAEGEKVPGTYEYQPGREYGSDVDWDGIWEDLTISRIQGVEREMEEKAAEKTAVIRKK